ncbi:MAG: PDZ domain-containing protein [Rhodobacteraceae bacterium]|nr:PDZ domain-containing protein [Paracoccaceae bacterium]
MLKSYAAIILILGCFGNTAQAGDPCPIHVSINDLGSPDWLDNSALLNALESRQIWIGISYENLDDGILLTRVYAGSPAAEAGLLEGDIVSDIEGRPTTESETFERLNIGEAVVFSIDRDGQRLDALVTIGGADPVPLAIVQQLGKTECRTADIAQADAEMDRAVMARLFTESRAFRCDDAHKVLEPLMEPFQSDTVYFVRGSRRLLLTMPYYGTACISTLSLDGENLNDSAVSEVIEQVISDYVRERFENP